MSNERDDLHPTGDNGPEWTKEQPGQERSFDFDAFLEARDLEQQVTDALDGKDLLDEDAYGTFPPGYIPRRGASEGKARHAAPEPEPEPDYPGEPPTQRFARAGQDTPDRQPPRREPPAEDEPPVIRDEPPPRPKVVVTDPTPRVYVTPETAYDDEPPTQKGTGKGFKFAIALLITVAVLLAVAALVVSLFRGRSAGQPSQPAPSPTDYLFGGMPTRAPSTAPPPPTAPPTDAPTPTPRQAPPQIAEYTVSVTAGTGGSVSPSGAVRVEEGSSVTFTITPDAGYTLFQLLVDGANVPVTDTYTFTDVRQDHVIYAIFQAAPTQPPSPTEPPAPTEPPVVPEQPATDPPDAPPEQPVVPPVIEE